MAFCWRTGEWLPLTPDNPALAGWDLNDILINTRGAADAAGATMMDRPEWIDTFPEALTAIATLTNNNRRGTNPPSRNRPDGTTVAGSARPPVDAINPRANNVYGHIITWRYRNDWTEPTFRWDVFALCGDPAVPAHGSTIHGDKFGSPDGICVAPSGRLWILDRRIHLDHQCRGLCGVRQQPDAVRRSGNRRDSPVPGRTQAVRDYRRDGHAGRADDVRWNPASE